MKFTYRRKSQVVRTLRDLSCGVLMCLKNGLIFYASGESEEPVVEYVEADLFSEDAEKVCAIMCVCSRGKTTEWQPLWPQDPSSVVYKFKILGSSFSESQRMSFHGCEESLSHFSHFITC